MAIKVERMKVGDEEGYWLSNEEWGGDVLLTPDEARALYEELGRVLEVKQYTGEVRDVGGGIRVVSRRKKDTE